MKTTLPATPTAASDYTLEDIRARKAQVLQELRTCTGVMKAQNTYLFSPSSPKKKSGVSLFLNQFDRGMLIVNGLILGYKLMQRIRRLRRF